MVRKHACPLGLILLQEVSDMPLYDYCCPQCGFFEATNGIDRAKDPLPCPLCQCMAERVIRFAPALTSLTPQQKKAIERNEQSAHAPTRGTKPSQKEHPSAHIATGRPWMLSH